MPVDVARFFLNLSFDKSDAERMHELTTRNQQGTLGPDELDALRNYRQIGLQIDLLRSKQARRAAGGGYRLRAAGLRP